MSVDVNSSSFKDDVIAEIKRIQNELNELKTLKKNSSKKATKRKPAKKTAKRKPAKKTAKPKRKTRRR